MTSKCPWFFSECDGHNGESTNHDGCFWQVLRSSLLCCIWVFVWWQSGEFEEMKLKVELKLVKVWILHLAVDRWKKLLNPPTFLILILTLTNVSIQLLTFYHYFTEAYLRSFKCLLISQILSEQTPKIENSHHHELGSMIMIADDCIAAITTTAATPQRHQVQQFHSQQTR